MSETGRGGGVGGEHSNQSHVLFDRFVGATTCKGTLKAFQELCDFLELRPTDTRIFYHKLKSRLNYWKAKALWAKLDKRASHKDYKKGRACANTKCLIIGAGPCGLRTAIELGLLGAKVVLLEKRDAFSRNNVLHLWPFTIQDLRGLGAKKFYGKFCAGAIDHISIRQLQLMLLKMALLLGVEIHVNVEFKGLIEPPEDQENERIGWRAEVHPRTHPVNELEFDVIIGADGRRNTLSGFRRKEFRGKLAIAITANFINRNTTAEAKVEEISGVAFIFNQKFFQDLREATGIDLENIVYYKDDTHYFVMTAKKQSLLDKGVILHDYTDTEMLLSRSNVDQMALLSYAREAADFSTNHQLPTLDFAINHYGQPDVAMFDFTCMYASENAALVRQRNGHQLLVALVGDSLLEPFWPMGTGIARGFLAAMDSAWMVRSWAQGSSALEVLAERESIYRLLPQTTPENVSKNFSQYSVDPTTRYPNISLHLLRPNQVRAPASLMGVTCGYSPESIARSSKLLNWCQRQTEGYRGVSVTDLTMSWKSGLALCAIIHRYRPDLIDFDALDERNVERNNQLGFDVSEREFGISPIMTGKEMSAVGEPDKLSMVMYLSQFYEMFKDMVPPGGETFVLHPLFTDKKEKDRKVDSASAASANHNNKVRSMATQLLAKFEENAPPPSAGLKRQGSLRKEFPQNIGGSDVCFFCRKRVYVMERLSAEGKFFHRSCFKCDHCGTTLRLSSYAFDVEDGTRSTMPTMHRRSPHAGLTRPSNASLEETPVKKADIIEEFWLKSAEIRKSLGLTPLDRSRPLEKSSMLTAKVPTPDPSSPKSYTPEDTSEDLKPTFTGRSIIRRLNITVEGQVISPVEPKSNDSERRDLSSSSGLGLNGSIATSQTAASESYNTSDSTMLTPPSSPPPPPPRGEEPATLKHKRYQVAWDKVPVMDDLDDQPKPIPTKAEPKKQTSPPMSTTQAPIPAPRTITVNSSVVMRREAKPRRTEVRKSFAESVEEIPFADDVEDTYDERTAEAGMQSSLYTPPTSKTYTEEELNAKLTRRVQKAARRQAKQEELKRLHRAQIIQRQLEQVEEKQRQLEERGVAVEKALRGEAGMGKKDDPKLMQEWFKLVQEKNALVRYESELMIFARELELEDRQSRLQQELRERMAVEDHLKTEKELAEEKQILNEMLEVVEQRDSLVALLEEQRLREKEEDKDLEAVMLSKGFNLNWA
uniref:F-actin monooxygenase n=1 Tax=Denticeps clupeoides TaxID=299321 RepID=A0AAY4DUI0_9TELE